VVKDALLVLGDLYRPCAALIREDEVGRGNVELVGKGISGARGRTPDNESRVWQRMRPDGQSAESVDQSALAALRGAGQENVGRPSPSLWLRRDPLDLESTPSGGVEAIRIQL